MAKLKFENWKGRRAIVVRENGRLLTWKYQKGSKLTKAKAIELYKENKTLIRDVKKSKQKLTNLTETTLSKSTTIKNRTTKPLLKRPTGKIIQYQVQGFYTGTVNGKRIKEYVVARSQKVQNDNIFAKDQAWTSFLERLAEVAGLSYDADEGIKQIGKVTDLREGWVSYK